MNQAALEEDDFLESSEGWDDGDSCHDIFPANDSDIKHDEEKYKYLSIIDSLEKSNKNLKKQYEKICVEKNILQDAFLGKL